MRPFYLFLALARLGFGLRSAPPLSSLTGLARAPDSEPRDVPAITNFWGSVGSSPSDVVGLSQVMLPPYLDVGVPTGVLQPPQRPCSPEAAGAWSVAGTAQYFSLVQANESVRLYALFCNASCSTSWHTATATMPAPFSSLHIVYHMQPGFKPFQDDGAFDGSCSVLQWRSGGVWCALEGNPSCAPAPRGVPLEGWQWTPTGVLRWGGAAASETRMLFEGNGVLQRVRLSAGGEALVGFTLALTGAVQRVAGMSWITRPAGSTAGYASQLVAVGPLSRPALLTCRGDTNATCAAWVVADASAAVGASLSGATATLSWPTIPPGATLELQIAMVVGASPEEVLALAAGLADGAGGFARAWDAFADGWEQRWADAFTPKAGGGGGGGHFSGSLPVLALDESPAGAAISRLFYMGALAILQAERTNLPLVAPRVYVTGTGNELCGIAVGGTEQWAWDQTFYGQLQALLDPEATRADLRMWVGQPIDALTGVTLGDMSIQGGWYAFNAVSLYRTYSTYLRTTGDAAFLSATGTGAGSTNETVDEMLDVLADNFLRFVKNGSTLADYSDSPAK